VLSGWERCRRCPGQAGLKIAGAHGSDHVSPLVAITLGLVDFRQIDLEFLAAQILCCSHLLPGFGVDGVPVFHVGFSAGADTSLM